MRDFLIFNRHLFGMLHFLRGTFLALLLVLLAFALVTASIDDIAFGDALYFVLITALTVGYGDITPASGLTQVISVLCAIVGVVLVGLLVAVSVRALEYAVEEKRQAQKHKSKGQ